jgi:ATP-binding cassette subfamily F protein 3
MDIPAKETLESAFSAYTGTILFVSHDRYFINQVADAILVFEEHRVLYYPFGYEHYLKKCRQPESEELSALMQAENQAMIADLKAVPKAERHRLREINTEEAYLDWKLRLAAEPMEAARAQVEELDLLWQEKKWEAENSDEELARKLEEAWDNLTKCELDWYDVYNS